MRLAFHVVLLALASCHPTVGPTVLETDPPFVAGVDCLLQETNDLRADCTFEVADPGVRTVTLTRPDGSERSYQATGDLVTVWDLVAETEYRWRTTTGDGDFEGSFTTPELSAGVSVAFEDEQGEPTWDHIGFALSCGRPAHVGVMSASGDLVWYQQVVEGSDLGQSTSAEGLRFTDEPSVLVVIGRVGMREFDLTGRVRLEGFYEEQYAKPVHHDVHRDGEWTYVLNADSYEVDGTTYVMDGLYVHDGAGDIVAEWSLRDHYTPSGLGMPGPFWGGYFGDAEDFSHANGIWSRGDELILSFRALSTVIGISGNPLAADFGDVRWVMDGDGDGRLGSDFTLSSAVTQKVGFQDQHGPNIDPEGRLVLFDNRQFDEAPSRALRLDFDPQAGAAEITDAWEMDGHCPVQGSAYPLASGNILATCAGNGRVVEFAPGQEEPVWSATIACQKDGLFGGLLIRAQPVNFGFGVSDAR